MYLNIFKLLEFFFFLKWPTFKNPLKIGSETFSNRRQITQTGDDLVFKLTKGKLSLTLPSPKVNNDFGTVYERLIQLSADTVNTI